MPGLSSRQLALAVLLTCAAPAGAGEAGVSHAAWRSCLGEAFALRAALSSRDLAAEAALRECRDPEAAYLDALGRSPLLDADDVGRARPALQARARSWLISGG